MTNWIIGPRRSGRSTELIELAAAQDLLIVTGDQRRAVCLANMAKDSGLKIRNPVSLSTWLRHPALFNDYKVKQRGILVDDADFVLECLLCTSVVYAVAESGEYVHKSVLDDMGIGGVAMSNAKQEWYLSPDGEYYNGDAYSSRDEAVFEGVKMFRAVDTGQVAFNDLYPDGKADYTVLDPSFYVGKRMDWWPSVDEDYLLDFVIEQADDYAGEFAEGWLDVPKEQRELLRGMLQKTFDKWIEETGNQPTFFMIEQSEIIDPRDFEIVSEGEGCGFNE